MQPPSNANGRPIELPGPLGDLARKVGGVKDLAMLWRVSPRTIYDWAHQRRNPEGPAQLLIEGACQRHGIAPPTWKPAT